MKTHYDPAIGQWIGGTDDRTDNGHHVPRVEDHPAYATQRADLPYGTGHMDEDV